MTPEELHDICKRLAELEEEARDIRRYIELAMLNEKLDVQAVQTRLIR